MIPYVEIRDKYTIKALAVVEPKECWFELAYQDLGEFEVYCQATKENLSALQKGRYVTIPSKRFIWVITSVRYTHEAGKPRMILAKGYEAKWLLKKRCILTPKELNGNITTALYRLVNNALGFYADLSRAITDNNGKFKFFVGEKDIQSIQLTGTQAPRGNLLEFVTQTLKTYDCGHIVTLENGVLRYHIFKGEDKTQSVRFSQSLDNLLSSEYLTDDSDLATDALVVSEVEDKEYLQTTNDSGKTGIDRAEILVASNLSTKYEDASDTEKELVLTNASDLALYNEWLRKEGNTALADHAIVDEVNGEIDILNSRHEFDKDFFLGDTVKAQDEYFNFFANVKILKQTFKQDANGYGEEAEYGGQQ